jgi:hypothetical protein
MKTKQQEKTGAVSVSSVKLNNSFIPDVSSFNPYQAAEVPRRDCKYVNWGIRNDMPTYYKQKYLNCSILQALINGSVEFTIGNGVINNIQSLFLFADANGQIISERTGERYDENEFGDNLNDIVGKLSLDLWLYGGCAMQVKYSRLGEVNSIAHIDMERVRMDKACENFYIINPLNARYFDKDTRVIKAYNSFENVKDDIRIIYIKDTKLSFTYPKPCYFSALSAIETEIGISMFNVNEIKNNFPSEFIFTFSTDRANAAEYLEAMAKQWQSKSFTDNGGEYPMLPLSNNSNDAFDAIAVPRSNFDVRYMELFERTRSEILSVFGAPPTLFGLPLPTGFADQEYEKAFEVYNTKRILPKQLLIQRMFNKVFGKINGKDAIEFKPFNDRTNTNTKTVQTHDDANTN